jgi:hypothetical protein
MNQEYFDVKLRDKARIFGRWLSLCGIVTKFFQVRVCPAQSTVRTKAMQIVIFKDIADRSQVFLNIEYKGQMSPG